MTTRRPSPGSPAGLVFALIVIALLMSERVLAEEGTWTTKAPMLTPRCCLAAGVVDGVLYVVGGLNAGLPFPHGELELDAYDARTNTWTTKGPMPTPRPFSAAAVADGLLYVVGGAAGFGSVEAYDPKTNTWSTKAPMPTPRESLSLVAAQGRVYAIGGVGHTFGGTFLLATVEAYDPKTDTWSTKAPMPTLRIDFAAEVLDGIIYVVGGQRDFVTLETVEAYDPRTDTWTAKAPMPTPRRLLAAGVVDGELYAVGGVVAGMPWESQGSSKVLEAYNPKFDAWRSEPSMPTRRSAMAAGVVDDTLYVMGGFSGEPNSLPILDLNEAFSPFLSVSIDIKPGDPNNTINLNSRATIQVAILSAAEFDALTVDPASLTLAPPGAGQAGAHVVTTGRGTPITLLRDVDRDGRLDLVVHFRLEELQLTPGDTEAVLRGATFSGQRIRGADSIRVLPERPLGQNDARGRQRR